jgi:hypothetical protein
MEMCLVIAAMVVIDKSPFASLALSCLAAVIVASKLPKHLRRMRKL